MLLKPNFNLKLRTLNEIDEESQNNSLTIPTGETTRITLRGIAQHSL